MTLAENFIAPIPAPVGKRVVAALIDIAILSLVFFILTLPLGRMLPADFEDVAALDPEQIIRSGVTFLICILIFALLWHAYFVYFELRCGWTPGKKAMHLRVISLDGQPLTRKQCITRELFRSYCDIPLVFPGIVAMLMSRRKQRLGDVVSETLVIMAKN